MLTLNILFLSGVTFSKTRGARRPGPITDLTQSSTQGLLPRQPGEDLKKTLEAKPQEEVLLPRVQGRLWDPCNTSGEN